MRIFLLLFLIHFLFFSKTFADELNLDFFVKFQDENLINYIELGLKNNHNLAKTEHILEQYRQNIKLQFASELPYLKMYGSYLGSHFGALQGSVFDTSAFILPFQVQYEADLLLKNRNKTNSKKFLYKAQVQNQKAIYISYIASISNTYINIMLYDYLIKNQNDLISILKEKHILNNKKFNYGIINLSEFNNSTDELEKAKVEFNNLIKERNNILYDFCLLIGESAQNISEIKRKSIENFNYADTIPKEVNINIIYERPDLIEIEEKLKSAKLEILIAKKEFLPSFNINGLLSFGTEGPGNFFDWKSSFAFLLAGFSQDIFKGGEKIANLKLKKAKYYELTEEYKEKNLNAIKEIANILNLISQNSKNENIAKNQLQLERKNFTLEKEKYKKGIVSKAELLDSKYKFIQKENNLMKLKATKIANYTTLYKALGGKI